MIENEAVLPMALLDGVFIRNWCFVVYRDGYVYLVVVVFLRTHGVNDGNGISNGVSRPSEVVSYIFDKVRVATHKHLHVENHIQS